MSCIYGTQNENVYNQYEPCAPYQYPQYPQMDMQSSQMYAQGDYNNNNNYAPQQQQEQQVYQQQQQQQYYYTQQQVIPQSCPTTTTYEQPQYQYFNYPQNQQYYIPNNNNNNNNPIYNNYQYQQNYPVNAYYSNVANQEYVNYKQESIHTKEEFEQQSYQESDKDENQSTCTPSSIHNLTNNQRESISSLPSTTSSPSTIKNEEASPVHKKTAKKTTKNGSNASLTSTQNFEKAKQSISKNNIRNFLTPIVRMRAGFVDYQLLEQQNVSTIKYDAFLKQHFYITGQTRLNIRQTIFDSLLDISDRTQLAEKKVFAMIVVKKIQEQFIKLLLEKNSSFSNQDFKQQFEWINGINESIVEFLNSLQD